MVTFVRTKNPGGGRQADWPVEPELGLSSTWNSKPEARLYIVEVPFYTKARGQN